MRVLGIGYGRHLFDRQNFEHQRLQACAKEVESFDQIIFSRTSHKLHVETFADAYTLHPTNSRFTLFMLFDALRIGHRLIQQKKVTTISTQDVFETALVGLVLKWLHPTVTLQVQEHGDVLASPHWRKEKVTNYIRYWFGLFVVKQADIVRVVSDRTKNYVRNYLGSETNIRKLAVTIDTGSCCNKKISTARPTDAPFVFVTAARFVPQKNFPLMLYAFAAAAKETPNISLKIFGAGAQAKKITALVRALGLPDKVEVSGWTNDLPGEMQKADAYLLTSNYEGWARVLIEALCVGLPVVTTDVGCVGEVVKDGVHGIVVPIANQEALSHAIVKMATDKEFYESVIHHLKELDVASLPGADIASYAEKWQRTLQ